MVLWSDTETFTKTIKILSWNFYVNWIIGRWREFFHKCVLINIQCAEPNLEQYVGCVMGYIVKNIMQIHASKLFIGRIEDSFRSVIFSRQPIFLQLRFIVSNFIGWTYDQINEWQIIVKYPVRSWPQSFTDYSLFSLVPLINKKSILMIWEI